MKSDTFSHACLLRRAWISINYLQEYSKYFYSSVKLLIAYINIRLLFYGIFSLLILLGTFWSWIWLNGMSLYIYYDYTVICWYVEVRLLSHGFLTMFYIIIIILLQGLGLLTCSGSEFIFLKIMNLLDSW
jgi:hypothetical protein